MRLGLDSTLQLNDGASMPRLGLGVYQMGVLSPNRLNLSNSVKLADYAQSIPANIASKSIDGRLSRNV